MQRSLKSTSCEKGCRHFFNWFSQLGVIAGLIFLIITTVSGHEAVAASIPVFCVFYILYIIMCFCSPTFYYLRNKHKADSIHQHMQRLYYNHPVITFYAVCYHYRTIHYTERDSKGNIVHRTRTEKVVTHTDNENFRYSSWRDVSGCFLLDSEKFLQKENHQKIYIKLELDFNVDNADDMTRYDYENQKHLFKMRNVWRDVHMDFSESADIDGFTRYNLVKINENTPACFNWCLFLIFTFFIPVIEIYKIYINSFCVSQEYTIKKIVSTRYNLNSISDEDLNKKYANDIPKIVIYGQEVCYDDNPSEFNKVYDLPTEDELQESKKYTSSKAGSKFSANMKKESQTLNKADFENQGANLNNYNSNQNNINISDGSVQMMNGGSMPMMNGSISSLPIMQGGSAPMINIPNNANSNILNNTSIPLMSGGDVNPYINQNTTNTALNNHDLEKRLLD